MMGILSAFISSSDFSASERKAPHLDVTKIEKISSFGKCGSVSLQKILNCLDSIFKSLFIQSTDQSVLGGDLGKLFFPYFQKMIPLIRKVAQRIIDPGQIDIHQKVKIIFSGLSFLQHKIGRASCRERVEI